MTAAVESTDLRLAPDAQAIEAFARLVFAYAEGLVPVRLLSEKGTPQRPARTRFLTADAGLGAALLPLAAAASVQGMGCFIVPGTLLQPGRVCAGDVVQMAAVLVDLDDGDVGAKREHLAAHLGTPSLVVASGGVTSEGTAKLHLYWRLTEAATGKGLAEVCRIRGLIARKAGGDPAFASAHQLVRVPGSVHNKHGRARRAQILGTSEQEYDLGELVEAVDAMPALPGLPVNADAIVMGRPSSRDLMTRRIGEGGVDGTTRFTAMSKIIGHWIRQTRLGNVTPAEAWQAVDEHNASLIRPPWPEDRLRREFDALQRTDHRNHKPSPEAGSIDGERDSPPAALSEDALAADFATAHAEQWKFVKGWGGWLAWTGTHWQTDATGQTIEMARRICRAAAGAAVKSGEGRRISSEKTIRAIERLARSDPRHAAMADEWDRGPMLLNTPAGILDLATGELLPHDPLHG